jgi:hypothetical protein
MGSPEDVQFIGMFCQQERAGRAAEVDGSRSGNVGG